MPRASPSSSASFQASNSQIVGALQGDERGDTPLSIWRQGPIRGQRGKADRITNPDELKKVLIKMLVTLVSSRMPVIEHVALGLNYKGPLRQDQRNNAQSHQQPGGSYTQQMMTPCAASWLRNSISCAYKASSSLECFFHHCVHSQPLGKIYAHLQEPGQKNQEGFRRTYTTSIHTTSAQPPAQPRAGSGRGCQ